MNGLLVLGNQLFDPALVRKAIPGTFKVFMREDAELCTYFKFHKHKIIFFLAAMRSYADELQEGLSQLNPSGHHVHYEKLGRTAERYEQSLVKWIERESIRKLHFFEIEDKFFEERIVECLKSRAIDYEILPSPMFLTSREEFAAYIAKSKRPFMKTFYESQRKRLRILVTDDLEPVGGVWSFDQENRLALPTDVQPPKVVKGLPSSAHLVEVARLVDERFASHPGQAENFWLPVDRMGARAWLKDFLRERLNDFGPYEDAIPPSSDFVYHSVLTPFLNTGLLTPAEVMTETLRHARKNKVSMNSLEGFIRQIIGWREFIRGIYRNFSDRQEQSNFWAHSKKLQSCWYDGTTGIPPLDNAIKKTIRFSYAHHIERLMVIGNLMLLLEVEPREAHRWFMEMFIDSSDWVMGPNVYGMALFSDGGVFATKPYICGSNYFRKMGGYKTAEWCDGVDGLYWGFIEKHKVFFLKNPRLSMMARAIEKMDAAKKKKIYAAAERLRTKLVKT